MPDYPTAPGCTNVTVVDLTGAEIPSCTVEPEAYEAGRNLPVGDRPPAPTEQLIGPPTYPYWY